MPKKKQQRNDKREVRTFLIELRKDNESKKMVGHAAVFNQETVIYDAFREVIMPGAFAESIENDDIRALFNHNSDFILGRNKAGTLALTEDETGLKVEIDPPDTQYARDLAVSIERGDITQMSFGFEITSSDDIEWERGEKGMLDIRRIKKVRLWDVSPVTFPAYEGTDIAMRSHEAWQKENPAESEKAPVVETGPTISARRKQLLLRKES